MLFKQRFGTLRHSCNAAALSIATRKQFQIRSEGKIAKRMEKSKRIARQSGDTSIELDWNSGRKNTKKSKNKKKKQKQKESKSTQQEHQMKKNVHSEWSRASDREGDKENEINLSPIAKLCFLFLLFLLFLLLLLLLLLLRVPTFELVHKNKK